MRLSGRAAAPKGAARSRCDPLNRVIPLGRTHFRRPRRAPSRRSRTPKRPPLVPFALADPPGDFLRWASLVVEYLQVQKIDCSPADAGIDYAVQVSTDLVAWTEPPLGVRIIHVAALDQDHELVTLDLAPDLTGPRGFARVLVTPQTTVTR